MVANKLRGNREGASTQPNHVPATQFRDLAITFQQRIRCADTGMAFRQLAKSKERDSCFAAELARAP